MSSLTPRHGYLAGFLVCAGLIGFALYLQYAQGEEPCPLCMLQRIAFFALGIVFLLATLHGPRRNGTFVYGFFLLLFALAGAAVAGRHVWLQSLPASQVPECGPGLDFILSRFPLAKAMELILRGSGECAEKGWTFLGLTIAGWSLVWFVLLAAGATALTAWGAARHARAA